MADKKTGSARRPRDDNDSAPKKKQSGTQKSLKKSSSRKPVEDEDEDDAPKSKKGSSRSASRDSARGPGGAPPARKPDAGKIFLYFVPGVMLLLIGAGIYVANLPDAKGPEKVTVSFDEKVAEAKKKYAEAKRAAEDGKDKEGEAGVPKLAEAYRLLCESHNIIQGVRRDLKAMEASKDPNVQIKEGQTAGDVKRATSTGYQFDEDDQHVCEFKVTIRKMLAERPGGIESIKSLVQADQAEEEKNSKDDDLLK